MNRRLVVVTIAGKTRAAGIPLEVPHIIRRIADNTVSVRETQGPISIGGLGIHLVRQIMDSIEYRREDGKNILTLTKKL